MEDVISDYAHRTVTMEYHPHLSGSVQHASIHPCQHGAVMKTIIKNLMRDSCDTTTTKHNNTNSSSSGPSVENYLFIFLKFVSSMIPTISYDFTVDVSASTRKWYNEEEEEEEQHIIISVCVQIVKELLWLSIYVGSWASFEYGTRASRM